MALEGAWDLPEQQNPAANKSAQTVNVLVSLAKYFLM
jgi:hypothetical protein